MSYNLKISVKISGYDGYAVIAYPEFSQPTYNLGQMFRKCMDWDYSISEKDKDGEYRHCYYNCDFAIEKIENGLNELQTNREKYIECNPKNGWGNIDDAIRTLKALRECIYELAEEIPINCLYMSW